ncbi:MAG: hypothetical protein HRJ53_03015 [Acidobacteria bacterium Pan2503]|uniref:Uncharacterized protein n=1 Tax=Candidatus Acidiferrum panamense TaxID=2741543 RepID=A0A7V8NMA8_9BACT|nr:hypothetical protein [Candidatus Acidoferrum panamensis]
MTLEELITPEELELQFVRDYETFHRDHRAGEAYVDYICSDVPPAYHALVCKYIPDDDAAVGSFLRCLGYIVQNMKERELARVQRSN